MKKITILLCAFLALVTVIAGCGSSASATKTVNNKQSASSAARATTADSTQAKTFTYQNLAGQYHMEKENGSVSTSEYVMLGWVKTTGEYSAEQNSSNGFIWTGETIDHDRAPEDWYLNKFERTGTYTFDDPSSSVVLTDSAGQKYTFRVTRPKSSGTDLAADSLTTPDGVVYEFWAPH